MADTIAPEFIPNPDLLLCRVHKSQFNVEENRIMRTVFEKPNQSADWSKYSTPEKTAARHRKPQDIRGVASITAEVCRNHGQEVVHDPCGPESPGGRNDAHAEIRGEKTKLIQSQLRDAIASYWANPQFQQIA